jgi:hypothetical protein
VIARVVAAVLVAASLSAACGGGDKPKKVAIKPASVPAEIVPTTLAQGTLALRQDDEARKAFSTIGDQALIADGRLWTIRQGERLVATLQVSTLKPTINAADEIDRETITNLILPNAKQKITINDVSVVQTGSTDDKTVYLWFGKSLFQVLQVKGSKIDPERILREILEFQQASPGWQPLPKSVPK